MAYMRGKKEHAFQSFQRDLKEDNFKSLVLFCGEETYLTDWAIQSIISKYVRQETKLLDMDLVNTEVRTPDDVMTSCDTPPMLSEKKVVIIKNCENTFANQLEEYASTMPSNTLLLISCMQGQKFDKKLQKHASVYDFESLYQSQLLGFIDKRFKKANKVATRAIITEIAQESGYLNKDVDYNLYNLEGDIKKIIALSEGDEVTVDDVRNGLSDNLEHGVFSLIDAISKNQKDKAFDLLNQLLKSGAKEFNLLGLIISQIEIMLQTKELALDGKSLAQMKTAINVHEYRIKKSLDFVRQFTVNDLKRILKNAYQTDSQIKTGILDAHLALEMLIAQV